MAKAPLDLSTPMDSPAKAAVRRVVVGGAGRLGMSVEKRVDDHTFVPGHSSYTTELQRKVASTPGMITLRRAMYLYWLAYASAVRGDVVEIGSWQGRSTIALAQACEDTDSGVVHAIDTFQGNPGHEAKYVVGKADLSDLQSNFHRNMANAGLSHRVTTYPLASNMAIDVVRSAVQGVRLVYIDGEHTYEAVKGELSNYAPLVAPGGVICFDDYSVHFPGVVQAVHEHLSEYQVDYVRPVQDDNFLVLRRRL